jgi:hypothetical protein
MVMNKFSSAILLSKLILVSIVEHGFANLRELLKRGTENGTERKTERETE